MTTQKTYNLVWQDMLDLERCSRYYLALLEQQLKRFHVLRFALTIAAAAELLFVFGLFIEQFYVTVAAGIIVLSVLIERYFDFTHKIALLKVINMQLTELQSEWNKLWGDCPEISDQEARNRNNLLKQKVTYISNLSMDITEDEKLNQKCTKIAYKVMAEKYAA